MRLTTSDRIRRGAAVGAGITLLVWGVMLLGAFTSARLSLNNIYFLPQDTSDTVVIVAIDNASLAAYGRSPVQWSRQVYAELIARLNAGGARVVALDVLFAEPTEDDSQLAEAIRAARFNTDGPRTRVVMPLDGVRPLPDQDTQPPALHYAQVLSPVPPLAEVADQLAYIDTVVDVDGIVRRAPSFVQETDGDMRLGFSLAAYLTYNGIPAAAAPSLLQAEDGVLRITPDLTPDRVLYIDANGLWQQRYFGAGSQTFTIVSLLDVVAGDIEPSQFEDKIVLVGLIDATGLVDRYNAPLALSGRSMAGVEIHANAIETLIQQNPLRDIPWALEALLVALLAIGSSTLYAHLRWYWMLGAALGLGLVYSIAAFVLFDTQNIILNLLYAWLALGLSALVMLGVNMTLERIQRERAEFLLRSVQDAARQRLSLDNMLPHLADDIMRVVPVQGGHIRLNDASIDDYAWGTPPGPPPRRDALPQTGTLYPYADGVTISLQAQGHSLGSVNLRPQRDINRRQHRMLHAIIAGAVPHLENAQLYAHTQQQNRLLQGILMGAPSGIIVLDEWQRIININSSVDYELDLNSAAYIQRPIEALLADLALEDAQRTRILGAFQTDTVFREELRHNDGVFYLDAVRLADIRHWVVVISNVTSLAQLNALKTHMIRMASHDLKNPLGSIMGFAELLQDESFSPEGRRFLTSIGNSAEHMLDIVTGILDVEQLSSSKFEPLPVSLSDLLKEITETYRVQAEQRGQHLDLDCRPNLPSANGDKRMLHQAFSNLVGNALKYTPDGGHIQVRLSQPDEMLHVAIQDNGYGIPKAAQERLFTQFYRVRTEQTMHIRGTGLGLSLVKSVVDQHQGRIWVESDDGQGSIFFVALPVFLHHSD